MNTAFSLVGLTSGALLGGVVLSLLIKRGGTAWPVVVGMIVSLITMIWIDSLKVVHWPWYTLIGFCLMMVSTIPLLLFSKRQLRLEA